MIIITLITVNMYKTNNKALHEVLDGDLHPLASTVLLRNTCYCICVCCVSWYHHCILSYCVQ